MPSHGNLFRTAADTMQNREGQAMTQFEQVQLDRRRQTQAREPGNCPFSNNGSRKESVFRVRHRLTESPSPAPTGPSLNRIANRSGRCWV